MTGIPPVDHSPEAAAGWEAAGRQIAPMLGSYSSAVVTASDELAAAHVAIGIGLAEAEHRRVAIADLVGEVDPLQSLVASDDPHGISDSFTFGVSLNKIAQPIDTTGNLFVMPSGTGSVSDPEIFRNARWQRLANGFREVGALLILVAPADARALQELIDQTDGVVLVGASPLDFAPYINVLARVPAPVRMAERGKPKKRLPIMQLAALLVLLAVLVGTGIYMRFSAPATSSKPAFRRPPPAATATQPMTSPRVAQTPTVELPPIANPGDSLSSSAYAVEVIASNAMDDISMQLQRNRKELPAATVSPVPVGDAQEIYYKLITGAFPNRREADALLATLRHHGVTSGAPGTVVRTPYALLIDSAAPGHTQELQKYGNLGVPVYILQQDDSSLKLYAGAFERPEYAATLMTMLRAAKLNPTLVFRTGRSP